MGTSLSDLEEGCRYWLCHPRSCVRFWKHIAWRSIARTCSNATNAHWFTPNGRAINDIGIDPDVVVELPDASSKAADFYDNQIEAAITQLNFEIKD